MFNLYSIFKSILLIIWLIDILDINFIINDLSIAYFLDKTLPINTLFWLLLWFFLPPSHDIRISIDKEDN